MTAAIQPTSGGGRPGVYRLKDGTRVPGVTTVLKYKDPTALMIWAHRMGQEGKDWREERDHAGSVGHIVHDWIEDALHGVAYRKVDAPMQTLKLANNAIEAFEGWRKMVSLTPLDVERPLVSEIHSIGGTYDCLALVNGKLTLVDWKSGNHVYPETIAQIAAYRQLIRESVGNKREMAPEDSVCLRIGKEYGDFHFHSYHTEILDQGWSRFLGAKMMYDADKILGKVCQ